jgi:hypothetical protein
VVCRVCHGSDGGLATFWLGIGFLTYSKDWKIYILMLSLTACVTGLSFNMSVKCRETRSC